MPSFLLQPLVENAIRHGVGPRLSGGRITVTAARQDSRLLLRVSDDGLGLSADWRRAVTPASACGTRRRGWSSSTRAIMCFRVTPEASGGVEVRIELPWRLAHADTATSDGGGSAR